MFGKKLKKSGLALTSAVGLGAALGVTALLCLGAAALIRRGTLPMRMADVCAAVSAGVAVWLVVWLITRARGRQALPTAACVAGGYVLLAALLCAMGGEKSAFGAWLWRLSAAVAGGGLLGAVMSLRQNTHRKRRGRKR